MRALVKEVYPLHYVMLFIFSQYLYPAPPLLASSAFNTSGRVATIRPKLTFSEISIAVLPFIVPRQEIDAVLDGKSHDLYWRFRNFSFKLEFRE